jgi:coenzyme F420-0:L-glutamate ligase/coenzyme F420-1:gamma-L-glutamate ligase
VNELPKPADALAPAISAVALIGIPEIRPGDDLAGHVARALEPHHPRAGDVLVLAHKAVSKAEGRIRRLADVEPSPRASDLARAHDKDARHVQVVLDEAAELIRAAHGVLIAVTPHGFVCANAGVDASNVGDQETVLMLPRDPDASARRLRAALGEQLGVRPAVLITDSFGRAWRQGQVDVTIGCAGLTALEDWRGRRDRHGRELRATVIAVADELAAAADLARTKDGGQPAVLVRGAGRHVTDQDGPGVAPLLRPRESDLFR